MLRAVRPTADREIEAALAAAAELEAGVRPSVRVGRAAALLAVDPSTVRRLIRAGRLQSTVVGGRARRVYVDSIAALQRAGETAVAGGQARTAPPGVERPAQADHALHRLAVARLRSLGVL